MVKRKAKTRKLQQELEDTRNRICQILDVLYEEFLINKEQCEELKKLALRI